MSWLLVSTFLRPNWGLGNQRNQVVTQFVEVVTGYPVRVSKANVQRAIIYTRVSSDRSGRGRSVAEQETECRSVCVREGWPVADVLVDNDAGASRWSKDKRPSYDRLAEILRPGDVLVTWEASRAQRDLRAYVALRELCTELGVYWCYSGRLFDLSRSDDRFMTLLDIGLAEKEVDQTRERIMRTLQANLAEGRPHGVRAYGYRIKRDPNSGKSLGREIDPREAAIVREMADRVLGGDSVRSIAIDFNKRGVPTYRAKEWQGVLISKMLRNPTYAGLRTHKGQVVGQGNWDPILTEDEHLQLKALLTHPDRRLHRGTAPKSLLSGIAVCGKCGAYCYRNAHHNKKHYAYVCQKKGCVVRQTHEVDEVVLEYMFTLLADPRMRERLAETDNSEALEARRQIDAIRLRLDEFTKEALAGEISPRAFAMMEQTWLSEIEELERVAMAGVRSPKLAALASGDGPPAEWERLSLEDQREIVRHAVTVIINPIKSSATRAESVVVEWRTY